jgi:hypothetical protein
MTDIGEISICRPFHLLAPQSGFGRTVADIRQLPADDGAGIIDGPEKDLTHYGPGRSAGRG